MTPPNSSRTTRTTSDRLFLSAKSEQISDAPCSIDILGFGRITGVHHRTLRRRLHTDIEGGFQGPLQHGWPGSVIDEPGETLGRRIPAERFSWARDRFDGDRFHIGAGVNR